MKKIVVIGNGMVGYKFCEKLIAKENKDLKLISDNKVYDPYTIAADDILEIWRAKAYISTSLPEPAPDPTMETLTQMMAQMQKSISQLNKN